MAHLFLEGVSKDDLSEMIHQSVKEALGEANQNPSPPPPSEDNYLTRKETARRLKVSLVTLTSWVNRSKLTAYKIGGRVLFRESEVEEALSQIVPLKHKHR